MTRALTASLLAAAGLDPAAAETADLPGAGPGLPSSFHVGRAAQASIAAAALAAAAVWQHRTGQPQHITVDLAHACAEFRSERLLLIDGAPMRDLWDPIAGLYPTADSHIRLHTNFPHHRDGILDLLGCDNTREAVAHALLRRTAIDFESEATAAGLCVAALRSFAQWDAHPHSAILRPRPPVIVERFGPARPEPLPGAPTRPLSGVRVLDLTRVIAGPVAARTLAGYGADVLHLSSPDRPNLPDLVLDTGRGKRSAALDLDSDDGVRTLRELVTGTDVFLQGYRAGSFTRRGFGMEALAALRPGIIAASLDAYGADGPWGGKRGFDSLVQTATGFNHAEAEAAGTPTPKPLPAQALDHASGYLLALGISAALLRRAVEGGSWRVHVSLATTGQWLRSLGRDPNGLSMPDPTPAQCAGFLEHSFGPAGRIGAVRHAARFSETPLPLLTPLPLCHGEPVWR